MLIIILIHKFNEINEIGKNEKRTYYVEWLHSFTSKMRCVSVPWDENRTADLH